MFTDFVLNGQAHGQVGGMLSEMRYDPGLLRPYFETDPMHPHRGQRCVTVNTGRMRYDRNLKREVPVYQQVRVVDLQNRGVNSPVFNATTLRKEEWIEMDKQVIKAARERLVAWGDLAAANSFGGFNGMSKTALEYEAMSDPQEAVVDMDGLTEGRNDAPQFKLRSLPLPITHSDFNISSRKLATSRIGGMPLDTTLGEAAGRRVAERIEKTTIGVETGTTYGTVSTGPTAHDGTSTVYGYINYANRLTKTDLTIPTGSNPEVTVANVIAMREQLYANKFYGPFMLYHSTDWDAYMDNDYARLGGNNANMTLRDRLKAIDGIKGVKRLDFLTAANSHAFTMVMVQMTSDVARAVNGMDITTVQWESVGGMRLNFKVMCIQVPQLRCDYYGNCGILHARTA